jgi:ketosteroid isomerase-like protein
VADQAEVIGRMFDAWNADDVEAALELVDPEIELDFLGAPAFFPGIREYYAEHRGFRDWWAVTKEPWEYFRSTPGQFTVEGDKVVVPVRFEAKGRSSGAQVELDFANLYTFRDGLIVKFQAFESLDEAFEAAGIDS